MTRGTGKEREIGLEKRLGRNSPGSANETDDGSSHGFIDSVVNKVEAEE
ncbi:MAG: hypothetical protein SV760_02210 [Halobacteria archaeon]|nr:hypothetical protein [Halobacteria archaeon]